MKKNVLFIFCHQDDEIAVFNHIKNSIKLNLNVFVLFLTSGSINKKINKNKLYRRDLESLSVLKNLGVKNKNIKFIGRKLGINVYELYKNYLAAYKELSKQINYIKGDIEIITHSWEGGNTDHDSCYLLVKKLYINNNKIKSCFQFSLYHSKNMPFNFYKVLDPITENGKIIKYSININDKIRFIFLLFKYLTQKKVWVGLYPSIIIKIIINKYGYLQKINKSRIIKKPHYGKLWYEKRNFISYLNFYNKSKFLLSNQ